MYRTLNHTRTRLAFAVRHGVHFGCVTDLLGVKIENMMSYIGVSSRRSPGLPRPELSHASTSTSTAWNRLAKFSLILTTTVTDRSMMQPFSTSVAPVPSPVTVIARNYVVHREAANGMMASAKSFTQLELLHLNDTTRESQSLRETHQSCTHNLN